jgi:hypothetical protein
VFLPAPVEAEPGAASTLYLGQGIRKTAGFQELTRDSKLHGIRKTRSDRRLASVSVSKMQKINVTDLYLALCKFEKKICNGFPCQPVKLFLKWSCTHTFSLGTTVDGEENKTQVGASNAADAAAIEFTP